MNNWFMPTLSFPDIFSSFQMPSLSMFTNWYNPFSYNYFSPLSQPSLFWNNTDNKTNTDTFVSTKTPKESINFKTDNLKLDGYNAFKGERLANTALQNSVGWTGWCAAYVKKSIQQSNLGSYQAGHAFQMPSILRNNNNFKEISPENVDVKDLPAGCVLVYGKGKEGYSKDYGHTEITTGDGRAVSDGITRNLYKKPSNIFIPV